MVHLCQHAHTQGRTPVSCLCLCPMSFCSSSSFSEIVSELLDEMPPDPTNLEDVIHSSLFLGKPRAALEDAARLDILLAAHLADTMDTLDLISDTPDE